MNRVGIVVPRYGRHILGGAETLARTLAENLVGRDYKVSVLTTRARDHYTWADEDPAGLSIEHGVHVWRFGHRQVALSDACRELWSRHHLLSIDEQYRLVDCMPQPVDLYRHLLTCQEQYDVLLFIPYLYPSTYYGSLIRPACSVIWPCLHDETMAHYHLTKVSMRSARGLMFNTEPECALAAGLGVRHPGAAVIGTGIEPFSGDADRFRAASGMSAPYLLYSGRLDAAKNVPQLLDFFVGFKRNQPNSQLKLVLMGEGPAKVPAHADIVQIGVKHGADMHDVLAGAHALCQPSLAESFSIVIMESWMVRRPVLVHARCAVTADHVRRSGGGWAFRSQADFDQALLAIEHDAVLRNRLGQAGYAYVTQTYRWDVVLDRFEAAFKMWAG